jgi:hypothetical protein
MMEMRGNAPAELGFQGSVMKPETLATAPSIDKVTPS